MVKKTVAILMATYNGEKYISEQIESILNQTYKDWILYISDDGSKDGTLDIIQSYINQYKDKICFVSKKEHTGAKNNFNFLLEQVKQYPYYMFADQDDIWLSNKIEIQMQHMQELEKKNGQETPILVFSDMRVVDKSLEIIADSFLKYSNLFWCEDEILIGYLVHNYTAGCCILCNKSLIDSVGDIPKCAPMHDYWISLVAASIGIIKYLDFPLQLYRQHNNNVIGAKRWKLTKNSFRADNIEKLRKEKKEKLSMAQEILLRYEEKLTTKKLIMIQKFIICCKKRNMIKICYLNHQYRLKLSGNYIFLLLLKI